MLQRGDVMLRVPLVFLFVVIGFAQADGPKDNQPDQVRRIPPPGIKVADADRDELTTATAAFEKEIDQVRKELAGRPMLLDLLPDVLIYHKAVDWALRFDEFYEAKEVKTARELLEQGRKRLTQLKAGKPEWLEETGLVVRGYRSKIDGSVQPYGLVVPSSYWSKARQPYRLDVWCHGRGENLTELAFIDQRQRQPGEFTPRDAFVLHPYGRYCNANKFAGEVDLFEALDHCKKYYPIDEKRLVMRGFSMGGAAAWQFAVHFPDKWCAAAPGAGFAETPEFLGNFQNETVKPTWWEEKLWRWYNATVYAENLFHCPTIAYSGENDRQKQAADVMARSLQMYDLTLRHVIGPRTGHAYHPAAKEEINRRIDVLAQAGLADDEELRFTTYTLRYSKLQWLQIEGMEQHWEKARVEAKLIHDDEPVLGLQTKNVSALTIDREPSWLRPSGVEFEKIEIDGQPIDDLETFTDGWRTARLMKRGVNWKLVEQFDDSKPRKKPGLQGPIDDAFLDSFLVVKPSEQSPHRQVHAWVDAELNRFLDHWRRQFRGVARVKSGKDVTEADIAQHHLIVWGVPASNSVLKKVIDKLPIRWSGGKVHANEQAFDADTHVPVLIYPNPLNPRKYVVLNSGFTFRDYDYLNNARQVPKLPDWAIVDITTPPNSRWPGKIAAAGFFGEQWEWKASRER
jgi:pimeloyl-ACP methyl ester carboxylesterase